MKKMQQKRIRGRAWSLLVGLVLVAMITACGPLGGSADVEATPTPEAIMESSTSGGGSDSEEDSPAEPVDDSSDEPSDPAEAPEETSEPTEEPEGDGQCLIGTWQTVPGTVETYLSNAFNETGAGDSVTFGVEETGGYLQMTFDETGTMTGSADEYRVTITIAEVSAAINVVIVLSGSAQYTADGSTLTVTDPNYQGTSLGDGVVEGIQTGAQEIVVDVSPGSFSAQGGPFGIQQAVDSGGAGGYECSGDTLYTSPTEYGPIEWMRVAS